MNRKTAAVFAAQNPLVPSGMLSGSAELVAICAGTATCKRKVSNVFALFVTVPVF